MQATESLPPEDYAAIAEKIRSGEFFRESRRMYDFDVHDPMAERYLYLLITMLSSLIFIIAVSAAHSLYPLQRSVPFIVSTQNIVEDLPTIHSLLAYKGEDASGALLRFIVQNYVTLRESYDIAAFDRNVNGVKSQSAENVLKEFQAQIDPRNPDSPIVAYQRHSKRSIAVLSSKQLAGEPPAMEIVYEAMVEGRGEIKKSRWQANISFNYSGIALDEKGGVKPVTFLVTEYRTKRLQDIK